MVAAALEDGLGIRALVRDRERAGFDDRIEVVVGDATTGRSIRDLVRGCDALVSALGPTRKTAATMVCSTATGHIIEALLAEGISRYVALSSAAVVAPGDRRNLHGRMTRLVGPLLLGKILTDKRRELRLLAASDLDWTLVRAPEIVDGDPSGKVDVRIETHTSMKILAGDVARVVVDQVDSTEFLRQAIFASANLDDLQDSVAG